MVLWESTDNWEEFKFAAGVFFGDFITKSSAFASYVVTGATGDGAGNEGGGGGGGNSWRELPRLAIESALRSHVL